MLFFAMENKLLKISMCYVKVLEKANPEKRKIGKKGHGGFSVAIS